MKYYNDVKKFHDKFGLVTPPSFNLVPQDLHNFRVKFFNEEFTEYVESYETRDLATAIDSLLDLVYITCGAALLHGYDSSIFGTHPRSDVIDETNIYTPSFDGLSATPHLLKNDDHHKLKASLDNAILAYQVAYRQTADEAAVKIADAFHDLFWSCINGALKMGFYQKRWDMMWDDVQKCNLAKERVLKASDSKRGSIYDVRKPIGWIPPKSEEFVEKMIKGEL